MTPELASLAKELGFRSAFKPDRARRAAILGVHNEFALPRVGLINGPAVLQEAELDGPLHDVRKLYRR